MRSLVRAISLRTYPTGFGLQFALATKDFNAKRAGHTVSQACSEPWLKEQLEGLRDVFIYALLRDCRVHSGKPDRVDPVSL